MAETGAIADELGAPAEASFLAGGGELGALIRATDWSRTPLGAPHTWPRSLRTAVRIMLTSRQPIWIGWGKELIYLYNDAYKSIIGGKHPWALSKPTLEVWREIESEIGPMLDQAMTGVEGTYVEAQLLIMERNGYPEETYYTFSYSPIPDDDGAPGGIICANTDDTQRVIGERQLALLRVLSARTANTRIWTKACERAAAAMARNAKDLPFGMIYVADAVDGPMVLAGAWGIERGHPLAPDMVHEHTTSSWRFAEAFAAGEPLLVSDLAAKSAAPLPTGAWRQSPAQAVVIPVPTGEAGRRVALVVGLNPFRLFDADYRRFLDLVAGQIAAAINNADAYQQQRRRAEALAELDRAKTAFFSNVSHEFRTPLTLMLGTIEESLAAADIPEARRAELTIAHRNSLRLLRLVNTLLDFSRVEAGRIEASYEPVDLAALTTELASNFRSACERAGLAFEVHCKPLPEPVYVDREMWEKIVLNLVSNAFKFTLQGGITVGLTTREGRAVLEVSDTGTGIPKDEQAKVFQRFHRVAGARGRTHEGTGIGLALVQELAWLHGGRASVESELGRGSTFTVSIPLGTAHLPAERIGVARRLVSTSLRAQAFVDEAMRWLPGSDEISERPVIGHDPGAEAAKQAGGSAVRKRVLVVDDNADMRDYVSRLLQPSHDVEIARDGAEALDVIAAHAPDLVLSDVMMPRLDGFGLLRAVRADAALADLPVILLSARAGEEAQVEGLDAGADDYLVKPFTARELLARVKANLQMAEIRRKALDDVRARERLLQERAALHDAIMATVPAAIWVAHDADASRMTGSRYASDMLRLSPDANQSKSAPAAQRPTNFRVMKDGREVPPEALPVQRACRGEIVQLEELDLVFDDGAVVHELVNAAPVRDTAGRVTGAVGAAINITERKRVEQSLRESEQRFRHMADHAPMMVWVTDASGACTFLSRSWSEFTGQRQEDGLGFAWTNCVHPEDRARSKEIFVKANARREAFQLEYRLRRRDGEYRWAIDAAVPRFNEAGEYLGYIGSVIDITERRQGELERQRLVKLVEAATEFIGISDLELNALYVNKAGQQMVGLDSDDEARRTKVLEYFMPEQLPRIEREVFPAVREKGRWTGELTFRHFKTGAAIPVIYDVFRIDDPATGKPTNYATLTRDITGIKQAEQQRELLINELNHRVKNTLASVQSVAMQTLRNSPTLGSFQDAFVSRLVALSRAHDLLTRSNWQSASLEEIVRQTLEPYGLNSGRIRFGGPSVRLSPSAAVTLSMGLHELATNAAKYGALSSASGRIDVAWSIDHAVAPPWLTIEWRESGGPQVAPPARRGFGSRLIERGIAQELDGEVALEFDPPGVQCRIRLPLSERVSAP
jgi:PAS domain S-box-containing protein